METETPSLPAAPPLAVVNGKPLVTMADEQPTSLPMPVQVSQIVARVSAVKEIVSKVFKDGLHFGAIPGTGDKNTLLKPGFDALCLAFQFSPRFIKQPESIERDNFINIVYKCELVHIPTGRVIATGDGSCNSKEEKYRWTSTARKCPVCNKETIIKGKAEYGGGWLCFEKKGGCKAKFRDGDPAIEAQQVGRIENDNPWNYHNTLTKMSQKRAGMAAIITACGLSGDFTQDVEDFPETFGQPTPSNAKVAWPSGYVPMDDGKGNAFQEPEEPRFDRARYEDDIQAAEADFAPASRAGEETFPADILKAREGVMKDLSYCKTKEDFQKLIASMRRIGGAMIDKRVTCLVNDAYNALSPTKPKTAPGATSVPAAP